MLGEPGRKPSVPGLPGDSDMWIVKGLLKTFKRPFNHDPSQFRRCGF